jgi:hypothetical protein
MIFHDKKSHLVINRWVSFSAPVFFALLLLFYLHPYYGIRHDATLYLGQALLKLDPSNFSKDLFFTYGSQASFTIFPPLIAQLLAHFDASGVFMTLTAVGLLLFLLACASSLVQMFPAPQWYWGLLALLVLPSGYGGYGVFSYAEPFFTGRSIAEPLALFAVAAYVADRRWLASLLWLLSALLHPLQALPILIVWWCHSVYQDRRWLHLLWLPMLIWIAAALGFPPFQSLTTQYDAEWLSWIREPNQHVFLTLWEFKNWANLTTDVFLVVILMFSTTGVLKAFARAVLLATLVGFASSLLLVDMLHFVLPTGLQLWRVHWILHWLAMAGIPLLLFQQYQQGGARSIHFWLLIGIVVMGGASLASGATTFIVWLLIPLYLNWNWLETRIGPSVRQLMLLAIPLALGVLLIKHGFFVYAQIHKAGGLREVVRPEFVVLAYPLVAGALVSVVLILYKRSAIWRNTLVILLVPALILAAMQWDRRSQWTRFIELAHYNPNLFGVELEPGAQVFWLGELVAPWLILHRPSYFNGNQEAGMLFNRGNAKEAVLRQKNLSVLEFQQSICDVMDSLNKGSQSCRLDTSAVTDVCKNAVGKLDYMVLNNTLDVPSLGSWKIIGGLRGDTPITYKLYRCKDFF